MLAANSAGSSHFRSRKHLKTASKNIFNINSISKNKLNKESLSSLPSALDNASELTANNLKKYDEMSKDKISQFKSILRSNKSISQYKSTMSSNKSQSLISSK